MAAGKEIRNQIRSIKNTQKITRAMEMVAASKMRKAQDRMAASKPYAQKIRNVMAHLAHAHPEYKHPYLEEREIKRVGYIIISSDRGLCGGLNANLFRKLLREFRDWESQGVEIDLAFSSPGHPGNLTLPQQIRDTVRELDGIESCRVRIVEDPPWTLDRVSDHARINMSVVD